jgi:hypothetical protein
MAGKFVWGVKGKKLLGVVNKLLKTKSLLTLPQVNSPPHNLNFHWRWLDRIQAIFLNLFHFKCSLLLFLRKYGMWFIFKHFWCLPDMESGDPHWVEIWFPLAHKSGIPEHLPRNSGGKQEPADFPGGPFTILTLQPPFELQGVKHCAWPVPALQSTTSLQFWQFSGIPKHPPPKPWGKQEPWVLPPRVDLDWQPLFFKQVYSQSPFVTGPFPAL